MKVGDLLTYESIDLENPWNGKLAILLEEVSENLNGNDVVKVYIAGYKDQVAAFYFKELVDSHQWRYGI